MPTLTKAGPQVVAQLNEVKEKNHPHLEQALIAVQFADSKPYVKDRLNLGRVSKLSKAAKLWLPNNEKWDFVVTLPADVWYGLFNDKQKEAWLDLLLTRCQVEYEPNTVVENGKKIVIKDEFGRVEYTDQFRCDDEGRPIWKVSPCDAAVIAANIGRYGAWFESFVNLKMAIDSHKEGVNNVA